jgi:ATP-dependent Lhr-like helicase
MIERFHPVVSRWFTDTFGGPSDVQKAAWPAIQDRKNTLIAAPNGSGRHLLPSYPILTCLLDKNSKRR